MKFSPRLFTQLLALAGLITVSAVEAMRPGTIGAAVNLGLVVLFGGALLLIKKTETIK